MRSNAATTPARADEKNRGRSIGPAPEFDPSQRSDERRSALGSTGSGEAALLGVASALLGILAGIPLAMVLTWVVNPAFFGWTIQFWLSWDAILWTPVWLTAVAMLAAWWPARIARRIGIAEALHEE